MARLRLGKPQVQTDKPTHVTGTKQGNAKGNYERQAGHEPDGRSTSERSTGVNAKGANPIDPRLSPG
jgi:hypothetical protein